MSRRTSAFLHRGGGPGIGFALVALVLTGGMLASACTSARQAASTKPASSPTKGGSVTYAVALDALPSGIWGTLERNWSWISNVFQPLVLLDPKTREPQPVLATKWDMAADGHSITITLRDDVTFHTGRKMTADDVKYTFEEAAKPANGSNLGYVAAAFTSMDVVNPTTLKISWTSPLVQNSLFDFLDQTLIVDKDTAAGLKDGSKVIGTGPYMFTDWKPGASYTLKKYDKYWDVQNVNLDSIEYIVTTDATAELSALRSGRAQAAWGLTASDAKSFAGNNQWRVLDAGGSIYYFGMNVTTPPFTNPQVRQAVAYAIDGERIKQQVLAGTGTVTDVFWGQDTPGVDASMTQRYKYDPEKAKKMIADAGATGASVPVSYGGNPVVRSMYEIVGNNLTAAGLAPTSNAMDQPTFQTKINAGELGAAYLHLSGQVGMGPATLLNALPPLRDNNPSHFKTPEYQDLGTKVLTANSKDASAAAVKDLTNYILDQAFAFSIIQAPSAIVVASTVQDVRITGRGNVLFWNAYVTK